MKLFQYIDDKGQKKLGLCIGDQYINVEETVKKSQSTLPITMKQIMESNTPMSQLEEKYSVLEAVLLKKEDIDFAPVMDSGEKILCVGLNYQAHIDETGLNEKADLPPLLPKVGNCLIGNNHAIHIPENAKQFDYEAELVIVIGKEAHCVKKEHALEYVFGYTIGNDFSARDLQLKSGQWTLGKACDEFAPIGPYLVTADEIDPDSLEITCTVNHQVRQHSNTSHMIYSCADIISYISQYITLKPGDMIFTGTPDGVILGSKGEYDWLGHGDEIVVSIEKIGELRNYLI